MLTAIIPVHNMADRLNLFEEWFSQTDHSRLELIIVEDGEDVRTLEELNLIFSSTPTSNVKVISGRYGSPGAARNAGLELTNSEWVTFWDSDDLPVTEQFMEMVELAHKQDSKIAVGNYRTISKHTSPVAEATKGSLSLLSLAINPGLWRWAFKSEIIKEIRFSHFRMGEDQLFLAQINAFDYQVTFFDEYVYNYSINVEGQLTSQIDAISELLGVIPATLDCVRKSSGSQKYFNSLLSIRQIMTGIKNFRGLRKFAAIEFLAKLFFLNPRIIMIFFCLIRELSISRRSSKKFGRILVNLTGGLGNQLFQLAAALSLSSGSKVLGITSLGKPRTSSAGISEIQSFTLPSNVEIEKTRNSSLLAQKTTGYLLRSGIWPKGIERHPVFSWFSRKLGELVLGLDLRSRIAIRSASEVGYERIEIGRRSSELLIGYFQSSFWVRNPSTLSAMKSIKIARPEAELIEFTELAKTEQPLIIHVRLGDYRNEPTFGLLDSNYYEAAIQIHSDKTKFEKIWVFSDEIESAKDVIPQVYHHMTRWVPDVDNSTAATFEAMRLGVGYIVANSSFSWWSAMLSHSENPTVIAPSPWFIGQNPPTGLVPSDWISLSR